jgi:glycerophosphoryl diester phosphodiesterase
VTRLVLVGQFSIPPLGRFPPVVGLPFGGISGLTTRDEGREIFGISDAPLGGRIYGFALEDPGGSLRVTTISGVALSMAPDDSRPDHEGIAALPDGTFAVGAEGTDGEPRLPPSINVYGRHGDFQRRLRIPDKFIPEQAGPATRGARNNFGFESLTLAPDGERLFTASETALIQDGDAATVDAGARTRILEFVARRGTFEPAREFAYDIEPLQKPPFAAGAKININGLVELLAVNRTTLLALERAYTQDGKDPARHRSGIRVFRISLAGATDVSALESLKGRSEVIPVTKTMLVDLSEVQGLSHELAPDLDNFEGMTFGPRLPDGRASLLLVSDDNFNQDQRTWFLLFAIE